MLAEMFDHTLLVAKDDPALAAFQELNDKGLANLKVVDGVGAEAFAQLVNAMTNTFLTTYQNLEDMARGVHIVSVTCHEREGNSATYLNV